MKIPKKYAVMAAEFMELYIRDGFWPVTPSECVFVGKVMGFGAYHSVIDLDEELIALLDSVGAYCLPPKKKCARLDVEGQEFGSLSDMVTEYTRLFPGCEDFVALLRYSNKGLCNA